MVKSWYDIWYEPDDDETVAFLSEDRIAEIGGAAPNTIKSKIDLIYFANIGVAKLASWCRQNCKQPGQPVNVRGQTGWAFKYESDALIFKLTWG